MEHTSTRDLGAFDQSREDALDRMTETRERKDLADPVFDGAALPDDAADYFDCVDLTPEPEEERDDDYAEYAADRESELDQLRAADARFEADREADYEAELATREAA